MDKAFNDLKRVLSPLGPLVKALILLGIGFLTYRAFVAPPAKYFRDEDLYRIVFFHVPCDAATTLFLAFGAYFSLRHLRNRTAEWAARAYACNDVAFLFALLAMATGIVFSKAEWGAWWQWDPRQYSFLVVLLIYGAYFALRISFVSEERARSISSAYACTAILPVLFLMFVFPNIPAIANDSFHPTGTIIKGEMDPVYSWIVFLLIIFITALGVWIYSIASRAYLLEFKLQQHDGYQQNHDANPAASGVVRPISISNDSR